MGAHQEENRAQWDRPIEFVLACVGYAVGIGNVWRFPYLCYKNGGAAFLIPYAISLLLAGIPIFYFELILGQFSSLGPIGIFKRVCPISQGIGWGMAITSFFVACYYNMLIAWILFYFVISFRADMLWSSCRHDWNTYTCHSNLETDDCVAEFGEGFDYFNKSCHNASELAQINETYHGILAGQRTSPAEEFLENYILNLSGSFENIGGLQWRLVVALAVAWVIVFFCLIKGVKSTGKVVYFTATFPYFVLIALLIRGVTLDGASEGIKFYIVNVNWTKLTEIEVWKDAAVQIFFSLGPAFGGLLTMASYNKFSNNCFRDALFVSITNCCTSLFAGFAVFSIAGFMAQDLGLAVKDVVRDGIGLAFIAYPEAISRMPLSPLWAVLFFFMLITLGLDSQFAMTETVTTAIQDQWPSTRKRTTLVCFCVCVVCFLCGLPMCTRAGLYFFTIMNDYSAGWCLMCLAFLEIISVAWIYGIRNFIKDIQLMLGKPNNCCGSLFGKSGWLFVFAWTFVTPLFLILIIIASFVFYVPSSYGDYNFPDYANYAGWGLSCICILAVLLFAIYRVFFTCCSEEPCCSVFKPSVEWCPSEERETRLRKSYGVDAKAPYTVYPEGDGYQYGTAPRSGQTVRPASYHAAYGYVGPQQGAQGGAMVNGGTLPQGYRTMPYNPYAYGAAQNPYGTMNGSMRSGSSGYYGSQTLPYGAQGYGYYQPQMMEMGTYGYAQAPNPYMRPVAGRMRKPTY